MTTYRERECEFTFAKNSAASPMTGLLMVVCSMSLTRRLQQQQWMKGLYAIKYKSLCRVYQEG